MKNFLSNSTFSMPWICAFGLAFRATHLFAQPTSNATSNVTAAASTARTTGAPIQNPAQVSVYPAASASLPLNSVQPQTFPVATESGGNETDASDRFVFPVSPMALQPPSFRSKSTARPPDESQVSGLVLLQQELKAYDEVAKQYKDAVSETVKMHYQNKRRETLTNLDSEIAFEKNELKKARLRAIEKLEAFISLYSGERSHPVATPDAMYRLAALYEERARGEDSSESMEESLKPALALYKRIIVEYPKYRELAGVYYFLGHAYNDSGRLNEAQQVWRSLVCHNKYPYDPKRTDPARPDRDLVEPMPQDNSESYWVAWRNRYQTPKALNKGGLDTKFRDPFPNDCMALPQPDLAPGVEPKYVAEVWWQIGNWEFDQLDTASGVIRGEVGSVYGYNRAASAYLQAQKWKKPPIYGVALYKYAWTMFKQQRYEVAIHEFVKLLIYTDEQEKLTGDSGADFKSEAFTYIAGSLANFDLRGPEADDPFIARPDIFDLEPRVDVAEKKLHVAIDRLMDSKFVPQDKPWAISIYRALSDEFRGISHLDNSIEVLELALKKWPLHPTAPEMQATIADIYEQKNAGRRAGTAEYEANAAKALEARTKLSNYIGNTPWVSANKDDPGSIRSAERLVRGSLRQAAATHTNNGRTAVGLAQETGDKAAQIAQLTKAAQEYKLAVVDWRGFLKQDENAYDAYESRYWLADAYHRYVRIQVALNGLDYKTYPLPSSAEIEAARSAAVDVRDSNEDDKYLDNAAFFVVDLSDIDRDIAYQQFVQTNGSSGTERREEIKFLGEGADRKVVADKVPPVVLKSIEGRGEYAALVPPRLDPLKRALEYQYYGAETYFLYGQFEEAIKRFEPIYVFQCRKSEFGFRAWEKLITMSNLSQDVEHSRALAEAEKKHSCAITQEQKVSGGLIVNPTLQEAAFTQARLKFKQAQEAPENSPNKSELWRQAAVLYDAALAAAPGRDEAPEAAMNAAYAYKQLGEYTKAIDLYGKFISEYGSEERLSKLEKGDLKAGAPADPKKYQERLQYLSNAYDALGTSYYSFFNYQKAAETYEKVASNPRFLAEKRKTAASNSMILYAHMNQREKMTSVYRVFDSLSPDLEEKARSSYLVASFDYKQWDASAPDSGQNRNTRLAAEASLAKYYTQNRNAPEARKYMVEAAYLTSKLKKVGGDPSYRSWYKNTILAWENWRTKAPTKDGKSEAIAAPYIDYVAEADFSLVNERIESSYEQEAKHQYQGSLFDVLGQFDAKTGKQKALGRYQKVALEADRLDKELDRILRTYNTSLEWVPAVLARQATLWDKLRTGLYNTVPPALKYFSPQQEKTLQALENSGRPELEDKANDIRDQAKDTWRNRKDSELAAADALMIKKYAQSVYIAQKYNVKNSLVEKAIRRLAYYTDILGDNKVGTYVTASTDPTAPDSHLSYRPNLYLQTRPGQTSVPPFSGRPLSSPVSP